MSSSITRYVFNHLYIRTLTRVYLHSSLFSSGLVLSVYVCWDKQSRNYGNIPIIVVTVHWTANILPRLDRINSKAKCV